MLIYKTRARYVGVCFELGIVEEENNVDKLMYRLKNGAEAMVIAVIKDKLDDSHLNKKVSLKYYFLWYFSWILKINNSSVLEQSKQIDNFHNIQNLAPSCI